VVFLHRYLLAIFAGLIQFLKENEMIVDEIKNAEQYYGLGSRIEAALRYLAQTDFSQVEPDRYDIDGDDVYALVQEYDSKPKSEGFWEAHHQYLDVQYVAAGTEHMGYRPVEGMQAGEYNKDNDFYKLEGDGEFYTLRAGYFTILKPQDAHMPGMAIAAPQAVKKVVVKVRV
jgi:YhcH/YjgK/YiaL family protein